MNIQRIDINDNIIELYTTLFPTDMPTDANPAQCVSIMNGVFGDRAQWWGLSIHEHMVAICTIGIADPHGIIYNVGVHPQYRQHGYATHLLNEVINQYNQRDLCLFVDKSNRPALHLYRKFNFEYIDNLYVPPPNHICLIRPKLSGND